jgi:hypothetical protein
LDYAGISNPDWSDSESLLNLVQTGDADGLKGVAISNIYGNFSTRNRNFHYIRYEDGSEELYNMISAPKN